MTRNRYGISFWEIFKYAAEGIYFSFFPPLKVPWPSLLRSVLIDYKTNNFWRGEREGGEDVKVYFF